MADFHSQRSKGITKVEENQKSESSSRMPLGLWHSLASGCGDVPPQQAYEAVRVHPVPGNAKYRRGGWPDGNRFYDYVWLVYSVFFFIQPIEEHSRTQWTGDLKSAACRSFGSCAGCGSLEISAIGFP